MPSRRTSTAANFDGLIVPEPDTYHFAVLIDGREIDQAASGSSSSGQGKGLDEAALPDEASQPSQ